MDLDAMIENLASVVEAELFRMHKGSTKRFVSVNVRESNVPKFLEHLSSRVYGRYAANVTNAEEISLYFEGLLGGPSLSILAVGDGSNYAITSVVDTPSIVFFEVSNSPLKEASHPEDGFIAKPRGMGATMNILDSLSYIQEEILEEPEVLRKVRQPRSAIPLKAKRAPMDPPKGKFGPKNRPTAPRPIPSQNKRKR